MSLISEIMINLRRWRY